MKDITPAEWNTILEALEFRDRDHDSLRLLAKLKQAIKGEREPDHA